MKRHYGVTCRELPNGNLLVTADNFYRSLLAEGKGRPYWTQMNDAFEAYSTNGSYTPFDAGDANPFVGLTGAPCIAESMVYNDDGSREVDGKLWAFMDYAVRDPLDELRTRGRTVFELVQ